MSDTKRPMFVSAEDLRLYEAGLYSVFMVGVETPNRVIPIASTQGADARPVAIDDGLRERLIIHANDTRNTAFSRSMMRELLELLATRDATPNINEQRYLWLREQRWNESNVAVVLAPKKAVKLGYDCPSGQRLDEIIDAARSSIAPREKT